MDIKKQLVIASLLSAAAVLGGCNLSENKTASKAAPRAKPATTRAKPATTRSQADAKAAEEAKKAKKARENATKRGSTWFERVSQR
ncbi:MAG: hypothetical protein EU981_03750 [Candidatus Liberibacter ctenarytainae]|uniref:Lipoprotein n=1 Tax=Candidatus Liberibacter ctenarytainae TaxID=2020335 RepID=A0A937AJE7_9HYPH|nr:hypothetical protein [Candidatus Liberibacter ctenarytainae]